MLTFIGNKLFSVSPTSGVRAMQFLYNLASIRSLRFSNSDRCVVIRHCDFNLHISNGKRH